MASNCARHEHVLRAIPKRVGRGCRSLQNPERQVVASCRGGGEGGGRRGGGSRDGDPPSPPPRRQALFANGWKCTSTYASSGAVGLHPSGFTQPYATGPRIKEVWY